MNTMDEAENISTNLTFERMGNPFTYEESLSFTIALGAMTIFGVIANLVTLVVILSSDDLKRNFFNIFLASLCVSDTVSALNSPVVVYSKIWGATDFNWPQILCKLGISLDMWTSATTIQHIVSFSVLRLLSVTFPIKLRSIKPRHAKITVVIIWFETLLAVFVPYTIWPCVRTNSPWYACTMSSEWMYVVKEYMTIGFPFLFYAPLLAVLIISLLTAVILAQSRIKRYQKRKREMNNRINVTVTQAEILRRRKESFAVIQLFLVVASFLLGYIPDIAFRLYAINSRLTLNSDAASSFRFTSILGVSSHVLLRVSECLNPLLYNLASSKMRKETIKFIFKIYKTCFFAKKYVGGDRNDSEFQTTSDVKKPETKKTPYNLPQI